MRINKVNKKISFLFLLVFCSLALYSPQAKAASLPGRILLQVESHGEAWYVNPQDGERYYLGRPHDAFALMRAMGLGVSNKDIKEFLISKAPSRLSGRILLQVEDKGQSYYVNPLNLKLYYLGRPNDAFNLMRNLGLGISNKDIASIKLGNLNVSSANNTRPETSNLLRKDFSFKYKNREESLSLNLSPSIFDSYKKSPKIFKYQADSAPQDIQGEFYKLFLKSKASDNSIAQIVSGLERIAALNNLSDDELGELALSFVQYIPYDTAKARQPEPQPYYPYETLYLNRGVCSDKTFLAYQILQELGYGVAIIDMPDINHSAIGIACEKKYSLDNSGYCYGETTNYFPISVIPKNIDSGKAENISNDFSKLFSSEDLGKVEIRNKTFGKQYLGARSVFEAGEELSRRYLDLINSKPEAGASYREFVDYNNKVDIFNNLLSVFYQK